MSLLESQRYSPTFDRVRNWDRAIWKEQAIRAVADRAEIEDRNEEAIRIATQPRIRTPAHVKTPRPFLRMSDSLTCGIKKSGKYNMDRTEKPGAFNARVTAAPGTGFLPKPNHFVPGVEKALGPVPKKLVKGDFPAEYRFAIGDPRMGIMLWPDSESSKKLPKPKKEPESTPPMTASASAPELDMAQTAPSKFFGRNRPPSGHRAQMTEARLEAHINAHRPDEAFGSTSYFLASKELNAPGWSKDWKNAKRADSGRSFYWGC